MDTKGRRALKKALKEKLKIKDLSGSSHGRSSTVEGFEGLNTRTNCATPAEAIGVVGAVSGEGRTRTARRVPAPTLEVMARFKKGRTNVLGGRLRVL